MRSVIYVPDETVWQRAGTPGGLSLLERQLEQLAALGLDPPVLLVRGDGPVPVLSAGPVPGEVWRLPAGVSSVFAALRAAVEVLPAEFVFVSADLLVDSRVLRGLLAGRGSILAAADGVTAPEPVGRATAADVRRFGDELPRHAGRLSLSALDPYVAELRGTAAPYILRVRSAAERRVAWRVLLDHVQKRTLDIPGQYLHPPLENLLVRLLAPTRVTPNQVTLVALLLATLVGMLFLRGWLRSGIALALVVGVLDGVDGKLARLKFATSAVGALEHIGDFFYENFWYLALAAHLEATAGVPLLWWAGLLLVGLDLSDNLLYIALRLRTGRVLDEVAPFDRRFRRIAGRRNVYVWMFLPGILGGRPAAALLAATAWAGVTVAVHAVRVGWLLAAGSRDPTGAAVESETVPPALVSEK